MVSSCAPRLATIACLFSLALTGCGSDTDSQPQAGDSTADASSNQSSLSNIKALGRPREAATKSIFDRIGERYALLIGVRNYDKMSGLQPLRYTENDVTELGKVLLQYGYRPENVILMTDSQGAKDPKLLPESRKIQTQLNSLLRDRGKADQILIAFSGHGLQFKNDKDSYFCPLDAQVENRNTLVSMGDLYRQLEECRAGFKMLLCDACRDDPMIGTSRGIADILGLFRDDLPPPGGIAVFYACSPGEFAREDPDLQHGVFFNFIIEGLRGAADMDNDGRSCFPNWNIMPNDAYPISFALNSAASDKCEPEGKPPRPRRIDRPEKPLNPLHTAPGDGCHNHPQTSHQYQPEHHHSDSPQTATGSRNNRQHRTQTRTTPESSRLDAHRFRAAEAGR